MRSSRNSPTLSDPFHWFSLSSILCGEIVVLTSCPCLVYWTPRYNMCLLLALITVYLPGCWQNDWDLHTCSSALRLCSIYRCWVWAHSHTRNNPASPNRRSNRLIDRYFLRHESSSPGKNLYSILEDPCNCRLTGPGSPDTKAQLSHRSEVSSSIRRARSCRSPKYSSTVSLGRKRRETWVRFNKRVQRKSHEEGLFYLL